MPGVGCSQAGQQSMQIIRVDVGPKTLFGQFQGNQNDAGSRIVSDRSRVQMPNGAPARWGRVPVLQPCPAATAARGEPAQRRVATMDLATLPAGGTRPLAHRDIRGQRVDNLAPTP